MADQEDSALLIKTGGANPERHAAREGKQPCRTETITLVRNPLFPVFLHCSCGCPLACKLYVSSNVHLRAHFRCSPRPASSPDSARTGLERITGFINWHRNRRKHLLVNTLDLLLSDIRTKQPTI